MCRNGWVLIRNKSTSDTLRVYINENDKTYKQIRPLHCRPFQFDDGQVITLSSAVSGTQIELEESVYKPEIDVFWQDMDLVENIPFCASLVGITTSYNCTTLQKGYATYMQVIADVGSAFIGTVEMSSDNGTTYSSAIPINEADPQKKSFEEWRVLTNIRVTRTAGTFTIYYR
jgi:hypothetical protein